jgi:regulator of RNase E activity RraA
MGTFLGEVHAEILRALGCVGGITNGSVRDVPAVEKAGFHLFAGGLAVSHAYAHIVEFGQPVVVGGLTVNPSDLLHGDMHGVLSVPADIAPEIPATAARMRAQERDVIALCRSAEFTLEKLRHAVAPL